MEKTSPNSCPTCGTSLDQETGSPASGLCPRCLLAESLETTADGRPVTPPPAIEEVSPSFPDLEIIELIGKGGMGAVFKARQKSLDRFVALKLLPKALGKDSEFAERFEDEAKALASLNHPNIVTIHDFGHQGDYYYLLMEFVGGPNLRQLIRDEQLTPEEALAIVPPLCEALEYAHDQNIVHRDIKPENLLLDSNGRVKIADFGISRIVGREHPHSEKVAGTPAYMAPEQKDAPGTVDSRADIYSLGVVLYELLTGERPGSAMIPPSKKKATLDVRLDEVILRALDKNPELRWQSATALNTGIQTVITGNDDEPEAKSSRTPPESNPARAYLSLALAIIPFLFIAPFVYSIFSTNPLDGQEGSRDRAIQSVPTLKFIISVAFLFSSIVIGLILGWRHLAHLRHQSPPLPAYHAALTGALFWPVLASGYLILAITALVFSMRGWFREAHYLGLIWAICFGSWLVLRTVARTKNQPFLFEKTHWLFTIPLIALALFIPVASSYQLAKARDSGHRNYDADKALHLESKLVETRLQHTRLQASGLGPKHPDILASLSEISSYENQLQNIGKKIRLPAERNALTRALSDIRAQITASRHRGLGPNHPETLTLATCRDSLESKLSQLPPPVDNERAIHRLSFLINLALAIIPAAIAVFLIRRAKALRPSKTS